MEKLPKIRIIFAVAGKSFDLNEMTDKLKITPTETRTKEDWPDVIKNNPNLPDELRPKNEWSYEKVFYGMKDLTLAYQEILSNFKPKIDILNQLSNEESRNYAVVLCIDCYDGEFPELVVPTPMIHFLEAINAEISFDIITYENEEDEE